jgi:hypothetical protein
LLWAVAVLVVYRSTIILDVLTSICEQGGEIDHQVQILDGTLPLFFRPQNAADILGKSA